MEYIEWLLGLIALGFTISASSHLLFSWKTIGNFPKSLKWAGRRDETFSRTRACIRELFAGLRSLNSGYDRVRSLGQHPKVYDC